MAATTSFSSARSRPIPTTVRNRCCSRAAALESSFPTTASSASLFLRHLGAIPVANPACRHQRDAVMADDIIEQRFQILDPVRYAGDVGVDRDCHHPRIVGAFEIKAVELVGAALQELL